MLVIRGTSSVTTTPKFTGGDVSLLGRCGRGLPAPTSQQSPGAIDYPCTMIKIGFAPGTLDPRDTNIAQWETVNTVTTLTIPAPGPNPPVDFGYPRPSPDSRHILD